MKSTSTRLLTAAVLASCLGAAPAFAQSSPAPTDRPAGSSATSRSAEQTKLDRSDKNFIEKAAKSGVKEQQLSQLAAERAANQRVKEYAQQLVQDHQQVNQELVRLAQNKGVEFDGDLARLRSELHGAGMPTTHSSTDPRTDRPARSAKAGTTTAATSAGAGTAGSAGSPQRQDATRSTDPRMQDRDVRRLSDATGREFDERYVKLMVKQHEDAVKLFEQAAQEGKDQEIRSFARQHVSALREHLQEARELERVVAE